MSEQTITWDKIVVAVILYTITTATIVGNILVLIAVKKDKKLQTIFNYYIVNLAITDILVAACAMSFMATYMLLGYWPFGEIICALWIFFDYGMTFVSVFTLVVISLDRFWSVTWSVHYRQNHTKRKCIISILLIWLFMVVLWFPPWILDRVRYSSPGECFWDPSVNMEFVYIVAVLGHHGPYCAMLFCYIHVFIFMRKRAKVAATVKSSNISAISGEQSSCAPITVDSVTDETVTTRVTVGGSHKNTTTKLAIQHDDGVSGVTQTEPSRFLSVPGGHDATAKVSSQAVSSKQIRQNRDRRAFITLSYIIFGYAILWLPFHIMFDISIIHPTLVSEKAWHFGFWAAYVNSTINPLLYNFSSQEFRQAFKKILCRKRK